MAVDYQFRFHFNIFSITILQEVNSIQMNLVDQHTHNKRVSKCEFHEWLSESKKRNENNRRFALETLCALCELNLNRAKFFS